MTKKEEKKVIRIFYG